MSRRPLPGPDDSPDRLYTVTGGRSRAATDAFDAVTLVVAESAPTPGMQSEHARILRLCANPTAVVELAADLGLPVSVVKILLGDLLEAGRITARHPRFARAARRPDLDTLKQVLNGLQRL
ncbi:DUF742 domain-containing protein [Kitasatospora viridis]|uniref:Uncharacterized protein DUF742 n=1 Tax=Kitasatospora viridis TaxID=281105 RepID=A0A561UE18_9ACTN|nr:DUF742 domain-containing protein [Kitasatospora viridis]TWF97607.1 uncharacterized protein DUF742 [Kitasatospora viridis]